MDVQNTDVKRTYRLDDTLDAPRYQGIVASFNTAIGTGVIRMMDGREVAVRYSSILGEGVRRLDQGSPVSFQLEESRRGLCAVRVLQE